jgi:hypothetical protein
LFVAIVLYIKCIVIPKEAYPVQNKDSEHPQDFLSSTDKGVLHHSGTSKDDDRDADDDAEFGKTYHGVKN